MNEQPSLTPNSKPKPSNCRAFLLVVAILALVALFFLQWNRVDRGREVWQLRRAAPDGSDIELAVFERPRRITPISFLIPDHFSADGNNYICRVRTLYWGRIRSEHSYSYGGEESFEANNFDAVIEHHSPESDSPRLSVIFKLDYVSIQCLLNHPRGDGNSAWKVIADH